MIHVALVSAYPTEATARIGLAQGGLGEIAEQYRGIWRALVARLRRSRSCSQELHRAELQPAVGLDRRPSPAQTHRHRHRLGGSVTGPQLCVVTGCRLRGRHLPGCPGEPECAGCLPRVAEQGLACDWCVGRAAAQLETLIDVTPAARDIAQRQTSRGGGSGAGKPGSSLPLDLGATARLDAVQSALTTWARHVSEERGVSLP